MEAQTIQVAERLNETSAMQLAADLSLLQLTGDVLLDFSQTAHFEPFGMLLVGSAINRLRQRAAASAMRVEVLPTGIDPEGIAAHMGFWRSVNLPIGREINSPAGKDTYLPITRVGVDEIYAESGGRDPLASGVIERRASELAMVLAQPRSKPLVEALTYSLRELMRNVLEHAMTPTLWLAGMSWPRRNYVQIAVLDEGRGIRRSLAMNERFRYESDIEAIRAAVQAGVSRNQGRTAGREKLERWEDERHGLPLSMFENAGYGLYMISTLCREAGQFLLASGSAALAYVGSGEIVSATGHPGTALRLVLHPSEVLEAWEGLFSGNLARAPAGRRPMLSASTLKRLGLDSLIGSEGESGPSSTEKE